MKEIHKKLEKLKIGSGTKSFRNGLSKGNMIFSEESSRTFYDLGNMEWIELRQTSATAQCPSCLKHVPEGLNMCQCVVWLRPNQSTLDRITTAFAAFFTLYYRASIVISRGMKSGHNPWQQHNHKVMDAKRGATKCTESLELVHGWTDEWVKHLDCISEIDISHNALYRQRLRCENTVNMRNKQDHCVNDLIVNHHLMFVPAFNELKAKEYLTFQ